MKFFLGIDGGGTKTDAVIIDDDERVVGAGLSTGSNASFTSREAAKRSFTDAIGQALTAGNLKPEDIARAGCTFGALAHEAFRDVGLTVEPVSIGETSVSFERAGVSDRIGVALIAGTGSSCSGRSGNGEIGCAGGWGAVLGDDGSAYDIGRTAIRRVIWAEEGRVPPTLLTRKALEYFRVPRPRGIVGRLTGTAVNQALVAGFAVRVSEAAQEGDESAAQILTDAGRELADMALFVAGKLFEPDEDFPLVLAGGVFNAGELVIEQIRTPFSERFPCSRILRAEMRPGEAVARLVRRRYHGGTPC